MKICSLRFSIDSHAQWAPGLVASEDWGRWAAAPFPINGDDEPRVLAMPAMLRRRAGWLGKMALEVAYACVGEERDMPIVYCSRHGEVARAVDLLGDLARGETPSPTSFGMAVHNASVALLTIARKDTANHIALAAGSASIEHALIEACGLLADGAPAVLVLAADCPLPGLFAQFEDCEEQPHAWAWRVVPARDDAISLAWEACADTSDSAEPGGLAALRFQLGGARQMERIAERRRWRWSRDA